MINAVEAILIAKLIRNTAMAPTTKKIFIREMVKILEPNSLGFQKKRFINIASGNDYKNPTYAHEVERKEKKFGIQYPD